MRRIHLMGVGRYLEDSHYSSVLYLRTWLILPPSPWQAPPGGNLAAKLERLADGASAVIDTMSVECYKGTILHVRSHPIVIKIGTVRVEMIDVSSSAPPDPSPQDGDDGGVDPVDEARFSPTTLIGGVPQSAPLFVYVDCGDCGSCLRAAAMGGGGVLCPCGAVIPLDSTSGARVRPEVTVVCPVCPATLLVPSESPEVICSRCDSVFEVAMVDGEATSRLIERGTRAGSFTSTKSDTDGATKPATAKVQRVSSFMGLARDCTDGFSIDIDKIEIHITTMATPATDQQRVTAEIWLEGITSRRTDHTWVESSSLKNAKRAERARKLGASAKGMHCMWVANIPPR